MVGSDIFRELRLLLEEEKGDLLTTPEDAAYFRSLWKPPSKTPPISPPPEERIVFTPPASPVVEITPPPPPLPEPTAIQAKVEEPPPAPSLRSSAPVPVATPPMDLGEMRALLRKVAPEVPLLEEAPSDAVAKRVGARWKARKEGGRVVVFFYQEPDEHRLLLEKITHAIDIYFGPARLVSAEAIEKKGEWEALLSLPELELALVCDSTLWQLPKLRGMYKELPREHKRLLGEKPLFLLPDLSLYLKDPLLKRSLWKAICQILPS